MALEKLTKPQEQFYYESYSNLIHLTEKAYQELVESCDSEGIQWLTKELRGLGKKATEEIKHNIKNLEEE